MKVVINQSNYIPWKGYFDLIHDADVFIFYDDVQFTVRDWRNRNMIKTPQGTTWLTIPVGSDRNRLVNEVTIPDPSWQQKHWQTLRQFYGKAPHFEHYRTFLEDLYLGRRWESLSAFNQHTIRVIAQDFLGIKTSFRNSEEFAVTSRKEDRILDLLNAVGATTYISGPAAKDYINEEHFRQKGLHLEWKDYSTYPEYPQFFPPFTHSVTILDLLFHMGPEAPDHIWGYRSRISQAL